MEKIVIVINGSGGVGKDTICDIVAKHYSVLNVSSIDPIKKIARDNGWNGEKTEKARKFLADLKQLFIEYNDLPLRYLITMYNEFMASNRDILFVHIREVDEIAKFKDMVGKCCITLLIKGRNNNKLGNSADDNVENYDYDYCYHNVKPLEDLESDFMEYFKEILESR